MACVVASIVFVLLVLLVPMVAVVAVVLAIPAWMLLLIAFLHPLLLHEIHRLAAGVVSVAMFTPVLLMARRYIQINRLAHHGYGLLHDDDRLRADQDRLRIVADVDAPVNARLVDTD